MARPAGRTAWGIRLSVGELSLKLRRGASADAVWSTGAGSAAPWRRTRPYLLLAPSLLLLAVFTYGPIVDVLLQSLQHAKTAGAASQFVALDNYRRLFADQAFLGAAGNNLLYAVGTVVPSLVLALVFALLLERAGVAVGLARALLFLPTMIPLIAAASLFLFIFLPGVGLLDYYLAKIGVRGLNWIGNPDIALWSIVGLTVWKNAGYYMLFYLAGLQHIPGDLREAAILDGAGPLQRAWHIVIPLLKPTTAFVTVIALVNVLTQVDHIVLLTKGGPSNATNVVLFYIYQTAHENFDLGKAAAATVVSVAALLALSALSLGRLEKGMHHAG